MGPLNIIVFNGGPVGTAFMSKALKMPSTETAPSVLEQNLVSSSGLEQSRLSIKLSTASVPDRKAK